MVLTNCLQMPGCGIGVGVMNMWMCVWSVGILVCECMVVWVCRRMGGWGSVEKYRCDEYVVVMGM